ncbi:hypothetical protein Vafri_11750, partial [Volvox africanus]
PMSKPFPAALAQRRRTARAVTSPDQPRSAAASGDESGLGIVGASDGSSGGGCAGNGGASGGAVGSSSPHYMDPTEIGLPEGWRCWWKMRAGGKEAGRRKDFRYQSPDGRRFISLLGAREHAAVLTAARSLTAAGSNATVMTATVAADAGNTVAPTASTTIGSSRVLGRPNRTLNALDGNGNRAESDPPVALQPKQQLQPLSRGIRSGHVRGGSGLRGTKGAAANGDRLRKPPISHVYDVVHDDNGVEREDEQQENRGGGGGGGGGGGSGGKVGKHGTNDAQDAALLHDENTAKGQAVSVVPVAEASNRGRFRSHSLVHETRNGEHLRVCQDSQAHHHSHHHALVKSGPAAAAIQSPPGPQQRQRQEPTTQQLKVRWSGKGELVAPPPNGLDALAAAAAELGREERRAERRERRAIVLEAPSSAEPSPPAPPVLRSAT